MNIASAVQSHSTFRYWAQLLVFLVYPLTCVPLSAGPADTASTDVTALIHRFIRAQQSFDPAALKAATTENYIEVSPLGEVDKRDAVLGFYDPAHRVDVPSASISGDSFRIFGDTAIDIAAITYTVAETGKPSHDVRMRATFVAVRQQGVWKLVSAHYTTIRPPVPQH
jgi:uncharacterized protein (TIGR02246 family)